MLVGCRARGDIPAELSSLRYVERERQRIHNSRDDLVLELKKITQATLRHLGAKDSAGFGLHELRAHADPAAERNSVPIRTRSTAASLAIRFRSFSLAYRAATRLERTVNALMADSEALIASAKANDRNSGYPPRWRAA